MAVYKCSVCGMIYDEEKEGKKLFELDGCPVCHQPISKFEKLEDKEDEPARVYKGDLAYDPQFARSDKNCRYMDEIHEMAVSGERIDSAMGTQMPMPDWDDILIKGGQLAKPPLESAAKVRTETVIGKGAKKPMVLKNPVYISHMSFGALSREIKVALAKGSYMAETAMCSGEGGILPEEREASYKYIFEYVPNKYSVSDENLKNADAIEIKIGQGTKPGMGGHLPGEKVTEEIAKIRGKKQGEDIQSPSTFPEINSKEDLKAMVDMLRSKSEGRPIGIKMAAGSIEEDLAYCVYAAPDFITIDGRGGATGSSPFFLREATSVPTIYALSRARRYLDKIGSDIELVITGGLRVSSDYAKALAMGADAIAIASAALIAAACQQYRICGSGRCPVGIATQDPELRARLDVDVASKRVANYLNVTLGDLRMFARITGHESVHDLNIDDLMTTDSNIAKYTGIKHVGQGSEAVPIKDTSSDRINDNKEDKRMAKYVCSVCGYVYEGDAAPEKCPVCNAPADKFTKQEEGGLQWASEHVVGVAQGAPEDIIEDLRSNFQGECSEVGMYLAMARVAYREGYAEIGAYWEKAAFEEAEHAAKFAELLGEVLTDSTKKNLEMRVEAENGATAGKTDLAKRAKALNLDAIHDTVHEMARDEARHGKAFKGLLDRYFG